MARNWQIIPQSGTPLSRLAITYLQGVETDIAALKARVDALENAAPPDTNPSSTATVVSLAPSQSPAGDMVTMIVNGTGFTQDTQIEVVDYGTGPNATSFISPTQVQTNYLFPQAPGVYQVGVRNPGEDLSNTKPFTVT